MNLATILTILSLQHIVLVNAKNISIETKTNIDLIIKCAIQIANTKFNFRNPTTILYNDIEVFVVNDFIRSYKGTVVVDCKRDGTPPKQVVVIVESSKSFIRILGKLKPDLKGRTFLNSGATFLILLSKPYILHRITKILWNYYTTDVLMVTCDNKNRISLYTYFPYSKTHLNCQNTEPHLLGYWKVNSSFPVDIYPDKMKNMQGCPLYISTNKLYHPVTEQKIALQIVKKTIVRLLRHVMNFTPIVSTRDYVSIDSDRAQNWSDSLNDVIAGLANISTCSIPLGIDRMGLLGYTTPYFRVRLAWLAPPLAPGPVWWRLLTPLNDYLWLVLLAVVFFVKCLPITLRIRVVRRFCYKYFKNIDRVHGVAIRSWAVLMGQPIRVAPIRLRDFYIISLWLWFAFVVRSAYQSVLIGALKTDTLVGDFTDLKETIQYGYRFGGRAGILAHFEHDPMISEGFEVIPEVEFEDTFRDVIQGKRKFVLATSLEYAWAYCLSQGLKEDECGHILPDSIMTVPLVIWMKMYSPFHRPLTIWLPRFIESGLLEHDAILTPYYVTPKTSDPSPLTSDQILSCMLCLLIGYAISILAFVFEILRNRTLRKTTETMAIFQN